MNYEEWSKSIELERTLTRDLWDLMAAKQKAKIFEQKETKLTKWRKWRPGFSSFCDPAGDLTVQEMKMRIDAKTPRQTNQIELWRTRARRKKGRKPMNYGEWSKSIELERTLTRDLLSLDGSETEGKIFEQKETKLTKWRKTRSDFSSFWDHLGAFAVQEMKTRNDHENENSVELDRTVTNSSATKKMDESLWITGNGRSRTNSIELWHRTCFRWDEWVLGDI